MLSTAAADVSGWYPTSLPATALGVLVDAGAVDDPMTGAGFRALPGFGPEGENGSNLPMPDGSPFAHSWWFRTVFRVPPAAPHHLSLQLDGVNYRANVWLNGRRIADRDELEGSYREFELPVTDAIDRAGDNVLAIEVFPPQPCDLALTWVDWNPSPPDRNMGVWRDVWLRASGPVAVRAPHVITRLDGDRAELTVAADLVNRTRHPQRAVVTAFVDDHPLVSVFEVAAGEERRVVLSAADHPALSLARPRLWWPRPLGEPELYDLRIDASVDGHLSDRAELSFGVREITSTRTADGHTQYHVNGVPVQIRGAGWATDVFLRRQPERDFAQLEYVTAVGLNTVRFEGMLERDDVLDWCDRNGVMVIAGWCCCDCWEKWEIWTERAHDVAVASLRSQIRRARRHPSVIGWWYGSDYAPPPAVERRYLDTLEREGWPNPAHSSASHREAELTGPSGLKMHGPYDYVPPNYWYEDSERGGAFGFATEICAGPAVPPLESLRRMVGEDHLWPIDDVWNLHCGGAEFHNLEAFTDALLARYGDVSGAEEFAELAQLMTYETQRAMFEAYRSRPDRATGVIQWMLNNAWPSLIWHLHDYYLRPGGGFFGAQRACRPVHAMYCYDDGRVVVGNDYRQRFTGRVRARVFDAEMRQVFRGSSRVEVGAGAVVHALRIPQLSGSSPLYFIDLRLADADGAPVDQNFYWVPSPGDVLDHAAGNWIHTPIKRFADLRALRELPLARPFIDVRRDGDQIDVELRNAGDRLAFFVQLRACDDRGDDVLPVVWNDNYITLLPTESRVVRAHFCGDAAAAAGARVEMRGLNVPQVMAAARSAPVPPPLRELALPGRPGDRDGRRKSAGTSP